MLQQKSRRKLCKHQAANRVMLETKMMYWKNYKDYRYELQVQDVRPWSLRFVYWSHCRGTRCNSYCVAPSLCLGHSQCRKDVSVLLCSNGNVQRQERQITNRYSPMCFASKKAECKNFDYERPIHSNAQLNVLHRLSDGKSWMNQQLSGG